MSVGRFGCALACVMALAACAPLSPREAPASIRVDAVPYFPQEDYQCGPAALATVLGWSGASVVPENLTDQVFLPARKGSLQAEMLAAPARHGRLGLQLPATESALLEELRAGHPVLVLQNLALPAKPQWHYAVLVGFDPVADAAILRSGRHPEKTVGWRRFIATWKRADSWAMVVLRPGESPATTDAQAYAAGALTLERAEQTAAAMTAYSTGMQRWPDEILMPFGLANMRYRQGDLAGAEQALRMALQIDPDAVPVLNNLAQVLIEQGCASLAVRYAERALAGAHERAEQVRQTLQQARQARHDHKTCRRGATLQEAA